MENITELIAVMRGGVPEKCDFCGNPFDEKGAVPEEAGDWACWTCWTQWESECKT